MQTRDIRDLVRFSDDEPRRDVLYETDRLWSEVICLQGAQGVGPMTDPSADGIVAVLAGEISAQVGKARARLRQWESVIVPAGEELTLRSASSGPSVVLLVVAPPPTLAG